MCVSQNTDVITYVTYQILQVDIPRKYYARFAADKNFSKSLINDLCMH